MRRMYYRRCAIRREYQGAARKAALTTILGGSTADLTIICDDLTGWPTGVSGRPFAAVSNRGLATEEKILCSSRTGNVLSVFNDGLTVGRGWDGTSITSHGVNSIIEHVYTATDADEANGHVNASGNPHGTAIPYYQTTAPATPVNGAVWVDADGTV